MTREELLEQATERLVEAAKPRKVILFGSQSRGEADQASDFDFLVVVDRLPNGRRSAIVDLLDALRPLRIPADVLVYTQPEVDEWGHLPGTLLFEALHEGQTLHAS